VQKLFRHLPKRIERERLGMRRYERRRRRRRKRRMKGP
jgi:hypothetical protein